LSTVVAALATAACAGGGEDLSPASSTDASQATPAPTLGLTPLGGSTIPLTVDSLPDLVFEPIESVPVTSSGIATTLLSENGLPTPEPAPLPEAFENTNSIGTLEIPTLGVRQSLFEGVTLKTLDNGPGHWPGTALPGQTGNVVVAGHRTSRTRPFYDIDKLSAGDEVVFTTSQGRHVYSVTKVQVVNPDALWIVDQTRDKTATLFACHPKGTTDKRIVAFLKYAPDRSQASA
jgi:sortase A